jgi:uncharacterized protein (DUF885 family)
MRQLVFGLVLGWAWSACAQTAPVADRVAKQNALFEEFYQTGLKNNPERATAYGDYRYNSQLGQYSLAEIARQHAEADDFLARLKAIPTDGMSNQDLLGRRILEHQLEREEVNYALKNYEMPVNQQNGVHTRLGRFAERSAVRFRAALPGLHLAVAPNPACAGTDHRGDATGNEGRTDATQACGR